MRPPEAAPIGVSILWPTKASAIHWRSVTALACAHLGPALYAIGIAIHLRPSVEVVSGLGGKDVWLCKTIQETGRYGIPYLRLTIRKEGFARVGVDA